MSFYIRAIFTSGIARNQIMLVVASIQIYRHKYCDQNGSLSSENSYSGKVIQVQDSNKNEPSICSETLHGQISTQICDLKAEIIETLRNDLEKIGARQNQEIRRRIEHLEKIQTNHFQ